MIPLKDCRHGWTYRIHSRNLRVGVFDVLTKGFTGIRHKWGSESLFTEFHWETGAPHGTVQPESEIEKCPVTDLRMDLGSRCCGCDVAVEFVKDDPKTGIGHWEHRGDTICQKVDPAMATNVDLAQYLEQFEGPGAKK